MPKFALGIKLKEGLSKEKRRDIINGVRTHFRDDGILVIDQ